ncbi:NUDIX hydrolase [Myxococcus phage Mx1]|nr:NUDIX hydrolase [Myxococcus phage Mx1]
MKKSMNGVQLDKLVQAVQGGLSDDLRKPRYQGMENCLAGHCYVASEALYHMLGGEKSGWVPQSIQHEGGPHWYLKHKHSGTILDPTSSQFKTPVPYEQGRGRGFLTKAPSKRAQVVIERARNGGMLFPMKKAESVKKMALASIPAGPEVYEWDDTREHDYSHVLGDEHRQAGYQLLVGHDDTKMWARVKHGGRHLGHLDIVRNPDNPQFPKSISVSEADLHKDHRGKGLGLAMYEGAFAHAKNVLGVEKVLGDVHSSMASRAHAKLAQKHGMNYVPVPSTGYHNSREDWESTPNGPYDNKYGPYEYALKSEDLDKVSLTPESTARRMTPHRPQGSTAYDRVETYDAGNGLFHHVFYDEPTNDSYQSVMHTLSDSSHPLDHAFASSASGLITVPTIGEFPRDSFQNNPWQDGHAIVHGETASQGPKGSGTILYQNMLRVHGRMVSDESTSVGANGVWEKIAKNPEFKSSLGYDKGHRHWAQYDGPKPTPISVIHGDGRSLEQMLAQPESPYKFEIRNFKLDNGGDYVEAEARHNTSGRVGSAGFHLDHANKKFYTVSPYWTQRGLTGGSYFDWGHREAAGPARKAVATHTGYTYGGDLPSEIAESHLKKSEVYFRKDGLPVTAPKLHPTETPEFKTWFGQSKVVHPETKAPLRVYHGTTHDFTEFSNKKGNPENWYGRGHYFTDSVSDVGSNYASEEGPDLKNRIESESERYQYNSARPVSPEKAQAKARAKLVGSGARTIPAYLRMANPVHVLPQGGTHFYYEEEYDDDGEPTGKVSGNASKLLDSLNRTASKYTSKYGGDLSGLIGDVHDYLASNGGGTAFDVETRMREHQDLMDLTDHKGGYLNNEFIRDVWRNAGHDGIVMDASRFGNMPGTQDTHHYIVFDPKQIKSAIGNSTFDPKSKDFGKDELRPIRKDEFTPGAQRSVSTVAIFNSDGFLLMGQRNDTGKWNCPGGKSEPGESPEEAAKRETAEETGLKINGLTYLGAGWGGKSKDIRVHCYRAESDHKPTSENDPDQECEEWEWVDVREGLPEDVASNLHNGKSDVLLQLLGLQAGSSDVELSKSWKSAFAGALAAAGMSTASMAADPAQAETPAPHVEKWTPEGLHEELHPIARLESRFGKDMNHAPHSKGEYHTAVGAVGLKPVTAHEEYKRSKWLQQVWPNLHDEEKFVDTFKSNHSLYNAIASTHWKRLKKLFNGDQIRAAYAWRWGQGKAARDEIEHISTSPYVAAYQKLWGDMQSKKVAAELKNPLEKSEQWLAKATRQKFVSKDGIVIPAWGTPARKEYDQRYLQTMDEIFGSGVGKTLRPLKVRLDQISSGSNMAVNKDRSALYDRMVQAGDRLPPVVVRRTGKSFHLTDGNHREASARKGKLAELDAFEIIDEAPKKTAVKSPPKWAKLYDFNEDPEGHLQPKFRQTKFGMMYEATDPKDVEKDLMRRGYHGFHHKEDRSDFTLFPKYSKLGDKPSVEDFAQKSPKRARQS